MHNVRTCKGLFFSSMFPSQIGIVVVVNQLVMAMAGGVCSGSTVTVLGVD